MRVPTLSTLLRMVAVALPMALGACGGGQSAESSGTSTTYTVGGTLSGLGSGKSLVLRNNGANDLTLNANGTFVFSTQLPQGAAYAVTLQTQPAGQTCAVTNGNGTINSANISNIGVACADTVASMWTDFETTANTLTVHSGEPLLVNAPFYGIEVRKNGVDISDDIVNVESLSPTSWRYTFETQQLNTSGATISVSLDNTQRATPGHYIAVSESKTGTLNTPQGLHKALVDCQAGAGPCAGQGAIPGLMAAVKGFSRRYAPRDLTTVSGAYDFSPIFADATFLASKGLKLHVLFTVKSFSVERLHNGDGATRSFAVPAQWDKDRSREIHAYVSEDGGKTFVDKPFTFSPDRTQVILASAPAVGVGNVAVAYARDPFPEAAWQMSPPIGGWYQSLKDPKGGGLVHAPWRDNAVQWTKTFIREFQNQWTAAIASNPQIAHTIEAVSMQETANNLGGAGYSESAYRTGLVEYNKFYARAVRRRALHEQMINQISGGGTAALTDLSNAIIPWGARLGGPDLFNQDDGPNHISGLEFGVYKYVHRALHDKALTMVWAQNDTYKEEKGPDGSGVYYTMAEQFQKARKAVDDTSTAGGYAGLEAEYMLWNLTETPQGATSYNWRDALPVIAANPQIQTTGNDRQLWRTSSNGLPIADQSLSKTQP